MCRTDDRLGDKVGFAIGEVHGMEHTAAAAEGGVGGGVVQVLQDLVLADVRVSHQQHLQQVVVRLRRRRHRCNKTQPTTSVIKIKNYT